MQLNGCLTTLMFILVTAIGARAAELLAAEGAVAERGVYLNIPASLDPLTVHCWSDAQWSWYLDTLATVHVNRLYFYIWQDEQSDFAAKPEYQVRNQRRQLRGASLAIKA